MFFFAGVPAGKIVCVYLSFARAFRDAPRELCVIFPAAPSFSPCRFSSPSRPTARKGVVRRESYRNLDELSRRRRAPSRDNARCAPPSHSLNIIKDCNQKLRRRCRARCVAGGGKKSENRARDEFPLKNCGGNSRRRPTFASARGGALCGARPLFLQKWCVHAKGLPQDRGEPSCHKGSCICLRLFFGRWQKHKSALLLLSTISFPKGIFATAGGKWKLTQVCTAAGSSCGVVAIGGDFGGTLFHIVF